MPESAFPASPALPATVEAPAKINLFLEITGRREDGYHELDTLFFPVNAPCDRITFSTAACGTGLVFTCDDPAISGEDNLVVKTYRRYAERTGFAPDMAIHLEKRIPYGSGLGGASSDAAAALSRLNALAGKAALPREELVALAASLGADIPFFLLRVPARATGIGEILTPVPVSLSGLTLVIACPPVAVSTPWAYRAYDQLLKKGGKTRTESLTRAIGENTRCVCVTTAPVFNSFEQAVFAEHPRLRDLKEGLLARGASAAAMSGSGSAIFGLFRDQEKAFGVAATLENEGAKAFVNVFR